MVGVVDFKLLVLNIFLLVLFFLGVGVDGGLVLVLVFKNGWGIIVLVIEYFEFKGLLERKGGRVFLGLLLLGFVENVYGDRFIVFLFIFRFVSVIVEGFMLLVGGFFDIKGCIVVFLFLFFFKDGLLFRLKFIGFFVGCGGGWDCGCVVLLLLCVDDFSFFIVFCGFINKGM